METKVIDTQIVNKVTLHINSLGGNQEEWGITNKEIAEAFSVGETTIREQKRSGSYKKGVHFFDVSTADNGETSGFGNALKRTLWTKKGIIRLAFKMKNTPQTIAVMDWVEDYVVKGKQNLPVLPTDYLSALKALTVEVEQKQLALAKIERDKPRVEFSERIEIAVNSINIGSYAKSISKEHGINVGQNKLFAWMRDNGILIKSGRRKNFPMSKYMDNGYFEVKTSSIATGNGIREVHTTLITGKGQVGLVNKIIDHFNKNN